MFTATGVPTLASVAAACCCCAFCTAATTANGEPEMTCN